MHAVPGLGSLPCLWPMSRVVFAHLAYACFVCACVPAEFDEKFDVGVSLHACGEASDVSMAHCVANGAAFVMCPCCVGKIKLSTLQYPRSRTLASCIKLPLYLTLAKAADYNA